MITHHQLAGVAVDFECSSLSFAAASQLLLRRIHA
jgi:hypothetical protein